MSGRMSMLSPNSINLKNVVSGGLCELSPQDVAAALAGLPRLHYLYAMHSFVYLPDEYEEDYIAQASLLDLSTRLTMMIKRRLGCQYRKAQRLTCVALNTMHSGTVCTYCNGHGVTYEKDGSKRQCQHCDGTAKKRYSMEQYATFAGITRQTWEECYQDDWLVVAREMAHIRHGIRLYIDFQIDCEIYEI